MPAVTLPDDCAGGSSCGGTSSGNYSPASVCDGDERGLGQRMGRSREATTEPRPRQRRVLNVGVVAVLLSVLSTFSFGSTAHGWREDTDVKANSSIASAMSGTPYGVLPGRLGAEDADDTCWYAGETHHSKRGSSDLNR